MFINLFSSFDPMVMGLPMNWVSSFVVIWIIFPNFWVAYSQATYPFILLTHVMVGELKNLISSSKIIYFYSVFFFILLNNIMGLFPYVFTSSTHPVFGMTLALPLWLTMICVSYTKQTTYCLAHLVPKGTPPVLQPFMVLIEIISNIIRPLTLTIRLTANMMAGHLLLTLLGSQGPSASATSLVCILVGVIAIVTLELGVAFIQAYVFSILSTLYTSEMDTIFMNKN